MGGREGWTDLSIHQLTSVNMVCDVVDRVLKSPLGALVHELNPDFKAPKMPFKRMKYTEAI